MSYLSQLLNLSSKASKKIGEISDSLSNKRSTSESETLSDREFLVDAYRKLLGREADEDGLKHYIKLLQTGYSRTDVLMSLVQSDEFINKVLKDNIRIQNLRELRPERYYAVEDLLQPNNALVFSVENLNDFDWLESMILKHGYYEKPGVWGFRIDKDKKVMAEIMSAFQPKRALEIGCANGTILQCLHEMNIHCEGIEISSMAIDKAFPDIKNNIHHGDLLELELSEKYDLIFGLDIFEHLNPNKLHDYLDRIDRILVDGGYLFGNIPAFGEDPIFGTVFPIYIKEWEQDIAEEKPFNLLHVDKDGYPINGHLIWADWHWWVKQFEQHGFQREVEVEKVLHKKYDAYMEKTSIARKSYFVFSKRGEQQKTEAIAERISSRSSKVL
ncbi:DUF4214 domain-containing protein [Chroococcidiopsis sp. CCNUC1]|uniref:DUF4214 domain-containing protein n=1 Tax=Chroococcidiopsis sp. CCNUC1 TaxID=2653189 RepID=UPI002020F9B8|nr:methyltransferase domain-containing protein [Chroococcidiopsis sp. CCNUC1]URD50129.1 methyltransferase domain-containing protein [Chroococcidiopsis sp. CCNUC1]